ncbi:hypothetical protein F0562_022936 [Nyssa sinensis]|uniref:MADS-box domain-containing protein n=1 Tax=Nyssa sinensis TaxID=561372 RepID=A0A5J5BGI1_9ASTE|nr:hypothetical protein F0562_022936 [Nyssa sinensis]
MVRSRRKMSMENNEAEKPRPIKRIDNFERNCKVAFKKRKESVKKKTMELSILCDIKACTICVGPNGGVDTWPENPSDVIAVIEMYKEKGDQGQIRQKVQLSDVLDDKVQKAEKQIDALKKECFKKVIPDWDECLIDGLSMESVVQLMACFDSKMEAVNNRIEFLKSTAEQKTGEERKEIAVFHEDFGSTDCWFESFDINGMDDLAMANELYQPIQTNGWNNFDAAKFCHALTPLQAFDPAAEFCYVPLIPNDPFQVPLQAFDPAGEFFYGPLISNDPFQVPLQAFDPSGEFCYDPLKAFDAQSTVTTTPQEFAIWPMESYGDGGSSSGVGAKKLVGTKFSFMNNNNRPPYLPPMFPQSSPLDEVFLALSMFPEPLQSVNPQLDDGKFYFPRD